MDPTPPFYFEKMLLMVFYAKKKGIFDFIPFPPNGHENLSFTDFSVTKMASSSNIVEICWVDLYINTCQILFNIGKKKD